MRKALASALAAAVVAATFAAPPADAAPKQKQPPRERTGAPPSLDGRVLGYPRTCGYDYFQYSTSGTPVGPYCH
jgi:hypothetical protein